MDNRDFHRLEAESYYKYKTKYIKVTEVTKLKGKKNYRTT